METKNNLHFSSDESLRRQFRKSDIINLISINLNNQNINIYHNPDLNSFYVYGFNSNNNIIINDPYDMNSKKSYYHKIIKLRDNNRFKIQTKINRLINILFSDNNLIEENNY